ncbi:MAG: hypothetical protein M3Q48_05595, partial [Actinomycetota bacterium]|nr:hypothetical protein [Actinomycetota bacterium]
PQAPAPGPSPTAPTGNGGQPAAVVPQTAKRRPPPVERTKPTRKLRPDDRICGQCGEGNPPIRRFCSRCGGPLEHAEVVKAPWWHRVVPRRKAKVRPAGDREAPAAATQGTKRRRKGLVATIRPVVAAILFVGTLAYGIYAPFREFVNERTSSAKDRVQSVIKPEFVPVNPTQAAATAETGDHPGTRAVDGFKNTFWVAPGGAPEPTLVLTFAEPVDLKRAIVRNGSSEKFQGSHRAKDLHFVYSTGQSFDITLTDTPDEQRIDLDNGTGVTTVEIHVVSVYRSLEGNDLALTEIELFTKKKR